MTVRYNSVRSANIQTSLGGPTWSANDEAHFVEGADVYTAGLAGFTANLDRFYASKNFSGSFGSNAGSVELNCDLCELMWAGREAYISGTATMARMVAQPANPSASVVLSSVTVTTLEARGGSVHLGTTANATTLIAGGHDRPVAVSVDDGVTAVGGLLVAAGARVESRRDVTDATVYSGGLLEFVEIGAQVTGDLTMAGGTVIHRGGSLAVVATPAGGTVDCTRVSAAATVTVTGNGRPPRILVPEAGGVTVDQSGFVGMPVVPVPGGF